jgi:hypothetical protein
MHDGDVPLLIRIPAGAIVAAPDPPGRATVMLHSVANEGASVYALVRDPRGARHLVVRVQPEPTRVTAVNLGATSPTSLAARDGVVVVVHHEPAPHNGTRLIATTVTCPP